MSKVFIEENGQYQFNFNSAIWATDKINSVYTNAKTELSNVDFVAETDSEILFVEYKNSNIPTAENPDAFDPKADKSISKVSKKYYDSLTYINAIGKSVDKSKKYIYILEAKNGDSVLRNYVKNRVKTKLPFLLQEQNDFTYNLIDHFDVFSIDEWNEKQSSFPITQVE